MSLRHAIHRVLKISPPFTQQGPPSGFRDRLIGPQADFAVEAEPPALLRLGLSNIGNLRLPPRVYQLWSIKTEPAGSI